MQNDENARGSRGGKARHVGLFHFPASEKPEKEKPESKWWKSAGKRLEHPIHMFLSDFWWMPRLGCISYILQDPLLFVFLSFSVFMLPIVPFFKGRFLLINLRASLLILPTQTRFIFVPHNDVHKSVGHLREVLVMRSFWGVIYFCSLTIL